jgi:hypothetical protein
MTFSMLHSTQSCEVNVRYIDEGITSWLYAFCNFDFKCSCVYVISSVHLFIVDSGGLVHVRNRYNTESVLVLEHADTLKPTVNTAHHTTTLDVFTFMCKLDGRKHVFRAQGS